MSKFAGRRDYGHDSDTTESEHYQQHSDAIQTILKDLDGYVSGPAASGSAADGYLAFFTGSTGIAGDNDLYYDRETGMLKIGSGTTNVMSDSSYSLYVQGTTEIGGSFHLDGYFTNYNSTLTDMGAIQTSDQRGYGLNYITDKNINNCRIRSSSIAEEGSVRTTTSGTFQIYLNGVWNDVVINFRFREDSDGNYELEHKPIGFTKWIEVNSGNSNEISLNGLPAIQQYTSSMGAYQRPLEIDGGTF